MKDAINPGGTSLEVLAPYLPYGIEIRHRLSQGIGRPLTAAEIQANGIFFDQTYYWPFAECLPVLRPFSALTTALEDGTVPAVEVIRACITGSDNFKDYEFDWTSARAELWQPAKHRLPDYWQAKIWVPAAGGGGLSAFISNDWLFSAFDRVDKWYLPGYDTLRRLHFALPVNGRPLIEGVDFIPKSAAAATPIQEGPAD